MKYCLFIYLFILLIYLSIPIDEIDITIEKNGKESTFPIDDLRISCEYLSEVVKSQRGRDAFIIENL